jgi:hypothetical protein
LHYKEATGAVILPTTCLAREFEKVVSLSTIPESTVVGRFEIFSVTKCVDNVFFGGRRNRRVTGKIMRLTQRSIDETSRTRFMNEGSSKFSKNGTDPDTRDARKK